MASNITIIVPLSDVLKGLLGFQKKKKRKTVWCTEQVLREHKSGIVITLNTERYRNMITYILLYFETLVALGEARLFINLTL